MMDWDYSRIWYHGSPLKLTVLREGSTITQDRRLAEVFSHKPPIVSRGDDGTIQHNGQLPGYLYAIVDELGPADVTPHPRSNMEPGKEWLTNRELSLALIGSVPLDEEELLTEDEIEDLWSRQSKADG